LGAKRYGIRKKMYLKKNVNYFLTLILTKKEKKKIWGKVQLSSTCNTNKQTNKCHKPKEFLPQRGKEFQFSGGNEK
jgi:hypothetical protein